MITKIKLYTRNGVISITKGVDGQVNIKGIDSVVKKHSEEIKQASKVLNEK